MKPYRPPPSHQRGAAGLTAILALSIAVIFAALAIDAGRLSWEARQLQNIADLAALDALEQAGPCAGTTSLDQTTLEGAAQTSAGSNGYGGNLTTESAVVPGTLTNVGGKHSFVAGGSLADATAVQVTISKTIANSLMAGGWWGGTTTLQRRAVAYDQLLGGISAGSTLVAVDANDATVMNALLGGLLGGGVNLPAAAYQTLADSFVSLGDLATAAGVLGISDGSVGGLVGASVTVGQFLQVTAEALGNSHAAYADINNLAAVSTNINNFAVGNLINITSATPQPAASATLNVYGLISGAAQMSNENLTVVLPMTLALPLGLGDVTVSLHIFAGPRYSIGPPGLDSGNNWKTEARSGQAQIGIQVNLTGGNTILGGLVAVSGGLQLYMDGEPASAWLESIHCAHTANLSHQVVIGSQSSSSALGIGQFNDITNPASGTSPTPALTVDVAAGLAVINADVTTAVQALPAQAGQLNLNVSSGTPLPQTQNTDQSLGTVLNNATAASAGSLNVAIAGGGGPLDLLLGTVGLSVAIIETSLANDLLSPLLNALDEQLLDPLLRGLGMHFGGNQITLHTIENLDARLAG